MRRVLSIVFPWYVLWRLRQLSDNAVGDDVPQDEWNRGYERAMWEVQINLGTASFQDDAPASRQES